MCGIRLKLKINKNASERAVGEDFPVPGVSGNCHWIKATAPFPGVVKAPAERKRFRIKIVQEKVTKR